MLTNSEGKRFMFDYVPEMYKDEFADTEKEVINAFGVWGLKKFMGKEYDGIHRKTFIIDEEGIVERVIDKVKTKEHAAQILE